MMTLSKQRKFTFNSLLEDIRGSKCCEIKVRQYMIIWFDQNHEHFGSLAKYVNVARDHNYS